MKAGLRSIIALFVLFFGLSLDVLGSAHALSSSNLNGKNSFSQNYTWNNQRLFEFSPKNTALPSNLSLSTQQLGWRGPFNIGVDYSDLTGLYLNSQLIKKFNENIAIGLIGEYGEGQYRANGTIGFKLGRDSLLKLSIERFNQNLPFNFFTGPIDERISQDAAGLRYEKVFEGRSWIRALGFGGYYAKAYNANLDPIYFISDGANCAGSPVGYICVDERHIAGGESLGGDFSIKTLPSSTTLLEGHVNYDQVRYNTIYTADSIYDTQGFGGGVNLEQILSSRLKFRAGAEYRSIYSSVEVALSWMLPIITGLDSEIIFLAQRVWSSNPTPDNNIIGLKINFFSNNRIGPICKDYQINKNNFLTDLESWVSQPAVKMKQVMAIAEEYIHLLGPGIEQITPPIGLAAGGEVLTIRGINFLPGLQVIIGGQTAMVTQITPTVLRVIAPAASPELIQRIISTGQPVTVDVIVINPDGQQGQISGGYSYTISGVGPILSVHTGSTAGGTLVTINRNDLGSATEVRFGGVLATIAAHLPTGGLVVLTPPHAAGTVDIQITTALGIITLPESFTYVDNAPQIMSINPQAGSSNGNTMVVIQGNYLSSITEVMFGSQAASSFTVQNDNVIFAITPPYLGGSLNVNVIVQSDTANVAVVGGFTYQMGAPTITQVSPNLGPISGGTTMALLGTNFSPTTTVTIGGILASNLNVSSSNSLTVTVPPYVSGALSKDIVLNNGVASITISNGFTYEAQAPTLSAVSPSSGSTDGGTLLTLTGTGFTPTTTVLIDGQSASNITVINPSSLTAITPAHATGVVDISVNNGVGTAVLSGSFTYTASLPTVGQVNPSTGGLAGGSTLTLTGNHLNDTSAVTIGGQPATITSKNNTTLVITTPAYSGGDLVKDIIITNPVGSVTVNGGFTYTAGPPTLSVLSPNSGATGGGTILTLTGTAFIPGTTVQVGGLPASNVTIVNASTLTAVTPAHAAGSVTVVVDNGIGTANLSNSFTYLANAPTISAANPSTGPSVGGTSITINGTDLAGISSVTIGGQPASITATTATSITVTTPAYVAGPVAADIVVSDNNSNAVLVAGFTYQVSAPTITGLSPSTGSATGGTLVTLQGTGFTPDSTVMVGTMAALNIQVINQSTLTFIIPAYFSGILVKDIIVSNVGGTVTLSNGFTYTAISPTLSNVTPTSGSDNGGYSIVLNGTGFTPQTTVSIGGVPATNLTVHNSQSLTLTVPPYFNGPLTANIVLDNGFSNITLLGGFTYLLSPPTLSSVSPSTDDVGGGATVTITGTHFVPGTTLTLGGVPFSNVNVINSTTLTAVVPAYLSGALIKDISLTQSAGSAALAAAFSYTPAAPTLSSVSPSAASISGGIQVLLTGTGFTPSTTFMVGGIAATNIIVDSATTLRGTIPAYAGGNLIVNVTVQNEVSNTVLVNGFTYLAVIPTLSSINPGTDAVLGGATVNVQGSGFTPGTTVTIGDQAASNILISNAGTLSFTVPTYVNGSLVKDLIITNEAGSLIISGGFIYTALAPTLSTVSPSTGSISGGTTLVLMGTGFVPGTSVSIGGNPGSNVTVLDATTLHVVTAAHAPGLVDITINNGIGSVSLTDSFTFLTNAPTLGSASPSGGSVAGGISITLSGTNLAGITSVTIGGEAATITALSPTSITVTVPAYVVGPLAADIVVSDGASNAALVGGFTYQATAPSITSVSPAQVSYTGGMTVTVIGTGFIPGMGLSVGSEAATNVNAINSTALTFTVPPYLSGSLVKDISITNGVGTATLAAALSYVIAAPTVQSISPSTGSMSGGTLLTIQGAGFTPNTTVLLGTTPATNVTVTDTNTLTALVPAYQSGPITVDISINNGVGTTVIPGGFSFQAIAPTITNITPAQDALIGGATITLTGTGFVPGLTLTIGTEAAGNIQVVNSTTVTATVPAYLSGTLNKNVTLTNSVGSFTLNNGFTYLEDAPTIASLSPSSGSIAGNVIISIVGSGFTPNTTVNIGTLPVTNINVSSASTLTATIPAYLSGSLLVDVVLSNSVGTATLTNGFSYQARTPTLSNVFPNTDSINGGATLTLSGSGFVPGTTVELGGIVVGNVVITDANSLSFTVPAYLSGSLTKDIIVTNSAGNVVTAGGFVYTAVDPTLTSVAPSSGSTDGGTTITLTGTGFVPGTTVNVGGSAATNVNVIDVNTLTAVTPNHAAGNATVTVNNGTNVASLVNSFVYNALAPTLNLVSPSSGSIAGGTLITITGTNLNHINAITIGGVAATLTGTSANSLTAIVPPYYSGPLLTDIIVSDGTANAVIVGGFSYNAIAPTLSSLTPASGSTSGGTSITLTGTGFTPNTTVLIGDLAATHIEVQNASRLTFLTPAYIDGSLVKDVTVNNLVGSVTLAGAFTYVASTPAVMSISPSAGTTSGNTLVTISGDNFTPGSTVWLGGHQASSVQVMDANTVTALTPPYSSGALTVDAEVNNGVASSALNDTYTYQPALPTIANINPATGSIAGGSSITITGTNFTPDSTVSIGGIASTGVTIVSATSLTVLLPAYTSGSLVKDVVVTNSVGSVVASGGFTYTGIAPTLSSVSPSSGSTAGGTALILQGTGFIPGMTITIGGVLASNVSVSDSTHAIAIAPAYLSGSLASDVVVNNGVSNAILIGAYEYQASVPTILNITPTHGTVNGGTGIIITGTDFLPNSIVKIGGNAASNINIINATTLTATVPAYLSGSLKANVKVNNGIGTVISADAYTYVAQTPTISLITPSTGGVAGGTQLRITGSGFSPDLSVTFDGVAASSVSFIDANTITAISPQHNAGAVDIVLSNTAGSATANAGFTYLLIAPTLTTISPSTASVAGGQTLTLNGTNLTGTTMVSVGGVAATNLSVVNDTQVTATIPAYSSGPLAVDVMIGNGSANATLVGALTYTVGSPTLTSITPTSGSIAGANQVTVSGTGFVPGTTVTLGAVAATNVQVDNLGSLSFTTPAYEGGNLLKDLSVNNGSGSASLSAVFTYTAISPTIGSISPSSGSLDGGATITVSGTGFVPGTALTVGGVAATGISIIDANTLTAILPAYSGGILAADVVVNNGISNATLSGGFSYQAQAPTLTAVTPSSGTLLGGTLITLTGTHFIPDSTVSVGGIAAQNVNVINATTLNARVPAYLSGPLLKDVAISNDGGTANLSAAFSYTLVAPSATSASPHTGPVSGGTTLTISGLGFTPGTTVTIGGNPATNVNITDTFTLSADVPAYQGGPLAADIVVNNGNSSATLAAGFTYQAGTPTLSNISPNSASLEGGVTLTLSGTNFTPATTVSIGGLAGTAIHVINATSLTVVLPAYSSGSLSKDVVINNGVGTVTASAGFSYTVVTPTISTVSPSAGSTAGDTAINLQGSGFVPGMSIRIGGILASNVTVNDAMHASASVPAYFDGSLTVDITVDNGSTPATLTGAYTYHASSPTITNITPSSGSVNGGTNVVITGTDFLPNTTVSIGGQAATNISITNAGSISATVPPYLSGSLAADLVVNNGVGSIIASGSYTYTPQTPTITSLTPSSGGVAGGTMVTIVGTHFTPNTTVSFGGLAGISPTQIDANTLTVIVPPQTNGPVNVMVSNSAGSATATNGFNYILIAPSLSSLTPLSGGVEGAVTLTLTGTHLTGITSVTVGGIAASNVNVVNDTTVTAELPAYVSGPLAADVSVSNGTANATLNSGFLYTVGSPTLTALNPSNGSIAGGTQVTLSGAGFVPGTTTVAVGGIPANNVHVDNINSLTFMTPAYLSGSLTKAVSVNNGTGSASLTAAFTYTTIAPTIAAISPAVGPLSGGGTVTITGAGFVPGTTVSIGGIAATGVNISSATSLTATIPAYFSGNLAADVSINNGFSNATLSAGFTYQGENPSLVSITPATGTMSGGTLVTVTGTHFIPGTTLNIGTIAAENINIMNSTTLTATIPSYVSGAMIKDVVLNNGVGSASLSSGFAYTASTPSIDTITPSTGSVSGNILINITGSGFTPNTTVSIGGVWSTGVTINSASSLSVLVPAYLSGALAADVVVNNGASTATLGGGFTYQAALPTITNISPNSGSIAGGSTLTLTGTNFTPATNVSIGGIAATGIQVNSANNLTLITPAYLSGAMLKNIVLGNEAGNLSITGGFTYTAIAPSIFAISPNSGSVTGNNIVTITGTGFVPGTTLSIGGRAASNITISNATSLTARVPSYLTGPLTANVLVSNGVGSATLNTAYTYTAQTPTISTLSPASGGVAGGTAVTIVGTNFTPDTSVSFGGNLASAVTQVDANTIIAVTPLHTNGAVNVVLSNSAGTATLTQGFNYLLIAPTLRSLTPTTASVAGGVTITLTGTNLTGTTAISIGGRAASNINVVNDTTVTALVPAYLSGALQADVVISNGLANASLGGAFTYLVGTPTLAAMNPISGTIAGGTQINLTGTGFVPGTTVSLSGVAASNVQVNNINSLTFTTPAYLSGSLAKTVMVNNGSGSASLATVFTYTAIAPTIANISPATGALSGGSSVSITGTGFVPNTTLKIGGVLATGITINSATSLTATVPAYLSGDLAADVVVNNGLSNATLSAGFTYQAQAPTVTNVTPLAGSIAGGTLITLTGTKFIPGTTLSIGTVAATNVTVVNASTLTATVPSYVSGALVKDLVVSSSVGSATLSNGFTYTAVAPTLSLLTPNSGLMAGGTSITLLGTGFTPNTMVSIGTLAASNINVSNATTLTATVPAYLSGSLLKDVVISNEGGSTTLTAGFTYSPSAPTLSAVTPNTGSINGGMTVNISGSGFTPSTTVTIGGVAATGVTVNSASSLSAVVPAYLSGALAANVMVNNGSSTANLNAGFSYQPSPPTFSSISPNSGSITGGSTLTLRGSNFTPGTTVTIGGQAATGIQVSNASTLTLVTPAYLNGPVLKDLVISNEASNATVTGSFTYTAIAPTLSNISANSGPMDGNSTVTLTGSGFVPGTTVTIGGRAASNINITSASTLTAIVPAYLNGALAANVVVNNGVGSANLSGAYTYTAQTPTITAISPSSGGVSGGTSVTITGTRFTPNTTVNFGAVAASSVTQLDANTLIAVTPNNSNGAVNVVVSNSAGSATANNGFNYILIAPVLSGISPSTSSVSGGVSITLTGLNLTGTNSVLIGGRAATNINVVNDTTVTALVPAYLSGPLLSNVVISNGAANFNLSGAFTYTAGTPTLTALNPILGTIAGGTQVTLTGTGFVPGTTVAVGAVAATNVQITDINNLTFTTPAYQSGSLSKVVSINNGQGPASLAGAFTYTAIAPTISSINPATGTLSAGGTVTISGTGFVPGTTVSIGGVAATVVNISNANTLSVIVPAYLSGALAADVVINNGASNATLSGGFTYQAQAPTIASISPNTGTMLGGSLITVTGANFIPGTSLTIGGIAASNVTLTNASTLTARVPAYLSGPLSKAMVITTSAGTATLNSAYTYTAVAPALTSITPTSGSIAGGTLLTLSGSGFTPSTTVSVAGNAASSVNAVNANTITALIPAYLSGPLVANVTVTNENSSATLSAAFTYVSQLPTALNISPSSGTTAGGTMITIQGTGFVPGTNVVVGGVTATNINVVNASTLTAQIPAYQGDVLVKNVVINNGTGTATLTNAFSYVPALPTITAVTPNTGTSAGGASISITGSNFIPGGTVRIGGELATSVIVNSASSISAVVPAYVSGSLSTAVTVTTSAGTGTLANGFSYIPARPNITSCSYPGGAFSSTWVCVGTSMNVFPNTFLNVQGGLLCSVGGTVSLLTTLIKTVTNLSANSLLPNLYARCTIVLCNNSTCTGLVSNAVTFS